MKKWVFTLLFCTSILCQNFQAFYFDYNVLLKIKAREFYYNKLPINIEIDQPKLLDTIHLNFTRKLLIKECENLLIILPKQLGCYLCQFAHLAMQSQRYQHYVERKKELELFIASLKNNPFSPKFSLSLLENMEPFKGCLGKKFYRQCKIWLCNL